MSVPDSSTIAGAIGLGLIALYYALAAVALRWRRNPGPVATLYDPPQDISPALAAYLFENGNCERAFAAALVSLASKGFLKIQQNRDLFLLEKLREDTDGLAPEEAVSFNSIFWIPSLRECAFGGANSNTIYDAYKKFEKAINDIADPKLMSSHFFAWGCGVGLSLIVLLFELRFFHPSDNSISLWSAAYMTIWILAGGVAFLAAVRTWPALLRKLASFIRQDGRPRRPLDFNDLVPVILTCSALFGFSFLAVMTSLEFGILVAGIMLVIAAFRGLLEAPTAAGRKALRQLMGFREFLSRADADRLNRENKPGRSPDTLEKFTAYAVALDVEHGWGEEFTDQLLEVLQFYEASHVRLPDLPSVTLPEPRDEIIQLNLRRPNLGRARQHRKDQS